MPFHIPSGLKIGKRIALVCTLMEGHSPLTFNWYKDGQPISTTHGITIRIDEYMSSLVIDRLDAGSNGNYSCRVSNDAGNDEWNAVLALNGKSDVDGGTP